MRCQEFREMLDSYLAGELLVETNHEVLRHLENCAACRDEIAARRALLAQMRRAVKNAPEMRPNPAFTLRLRKDLRQNALRPPVWEKLKNGFFAHHPILAATAAACLLLAVVFGAIWLKSSPSPENIVARQNQTNEAAEIPRPTESPVMQAVKIAWRETMRAAIGDHENCALQYNLPDEPITLAEAAEKYGRYNKDLDKTVIAALKPEAADDETSGKSTGKLEFIDSHSCVYNGRRFTHIELQKGDKIISLLVTDAGDLTVEDEGINGNQTIGNFQIAGFRQARYAVFVVSDLSEAENSLVAETIFPAVRRHLERAEA